MIDQFVNFVIRPPRAEYNPDQYLWEKDFSLAGRKYKREDVELRNERGHTLRCSHYVPAHFPDDVPLPCVIYCHGNSGCRADANEAAVVLLPSDITVFTLDFSGSGLSEGDYVSLGWHEKNDLKVAVSYLRSNKKISGIGLWGRSMGAVTSLLYGAEDPSIAGMVLDSAFSSLFDLMMELADVYKIRLPKFTVKMALHYMRRVILKKAKFDIMRLDCVKVAPKTYIPALFGHAKDDIFIQPQHSDSIFRSYAGDKNIIKFDGDHNSSRPQFYYDSVSIFFFNVLRPPQPPPTSLLSKIEKYCNLVEDMKAGKGFEENILYKIISGLRNASGDAPSSSSTTRTVIPKKSVEELLSDIAPVCNHDTLAIDDTEFHIDDTLILEKQSGQNVEEHCFYTTNSNRESWGRCSSLGNVSDYNGVDCTSSNNNYDQAKAIKVLATPLRNPQQSTLLSPRKADMSEKRSTLLDTRKDDKENKNKQCKKRMKKKKKNNDEEQKKSKHEKFEKLEALSQRLRLCILKRVSHKRHCSS